MPIRRFDLKQLLDYFYDIGGKRWGQILQLEKLEKVFKPIKDGKKELSLNHLKTVGEDWAFLNWWKMPTIREKDLEPFRGVFVDLGTQNKRIIGKLYDLLKNIEIVSCILRFIDPQNYGIMSPPVENILSVKGKDRIEKYLNYLEDLEDLKEEYDFQRIADVDMALWALANIINYSELKHHPVFSNIYDEYDQTANPIKKIMARNSLEQIKEEEPLYKAELFFDSDFVTAGLIAGRVLDLYVKELCDKNGIKRIERTKKIDYRYLSIPELAEKLTNIKVITTEEGDKVKSWWDVRCKLTHEDELPVTQQDVREMIAGISEFLQEYQSG